MANTRRTNLGKVLVTSVRLTSDEHEALKAIAAAERRSLSDQIRHLIDEAHKSMERAA